MESNQVFEALKIIIATSVFFVWVVRYDNIIKEFKHYNLPNWLRDLVGILKLSSVFMILSSKPMLVELGAASLAGLMLVALVVHLKVRNPIPKMIPALTLLIFSVLIFMANVTRAPALALN